MNHLEWRNCRECGTPLKENNFGENDCPKCNSEKFFPVKNKSQEVIKNTVGVEPLPKEEELLPIKD